MDRITRRWSARARERARYEADGYQTASTWLGRPLDAAGWQRAYDLFLSRWLAVAAAAASTAEARAALAAEREALDV